MKSSTELKTMLSVYRHCVEFRSSLLNPYIIRTFSLKGILSEEANETSLLPKDALMNKLGVFSNLMKAVSAIKYVRQAQQSLIPIVFQKWKELAFEGRANRLRKLVSQSHSQRSAPDVVEEEAPNAIG